MPVTSEFVAKSRLWVIDVASAADDANYQNELNHIVDQIATTGGGTAELWIHGVTEAADALATSLGAVPYRDLWQVRRSRLGPSLLLTPTHWSPSTIVHSRGTPNKGA